MDINERIRFIGNAIVEREREIFHYKFNIANYIDMLKELPQGDWDEDILKYKMGHPINEVSDEIFFRIEEFKLRDLLRARLRTEKVALNTSLRALTALLTRSKEYDPQELAKAIQCVKNEIRGS